ncbi:MAG: VWA domain-containing protein, partial [Chloroflexi bacterium]|nr:VWA domain-containing protein [Chloroflexota bacterium]
MLNPVMFENSRTDGIPVLEIVPEPAPSKHQPRRFVPLKRSELRGELLGPLATLTLVQTFSYSRAELDKVVEALYRFPLPGDAAVRSVVVRFGEVEIVAALKERAQAESEYEAAKQQGQQAALATRESPSVFTLRVAGLRPDEPVVVETSYVQLARPEGPGWTLRLPLTTAPRYVREDEAGSRAAQGQPLLLLRDPGHRFALDLRVRGAHEVLSPTHALTLQPVEAAVGDWRVTLRGGEVLPDRDCVLTWSPPQPSERPHLQVHTFDDAASGWTYWLALVAPPAAQAHPAVPRQVTLLVDHSGSMTGAKWEAADWGVVRFLNDLTERDAFALGLFHSSAAWLARDLRPATSTNVQEAIAFLKGHRDSGGTNLGVALEQGLDIAPLPGEHARHLLLVTDAQVTDEGRIRRLVDDEARRDDRRRV